MDHWSVIFEQYLTHIWWMILNLHKAKLWGWALVISTLMGCQHRISKSIDREAFQEPRCMSEHRIPSMGTFFELQLVHACEFKPAILITEVKALLDSLESELSLYQPDSQISQLNLQGTLCSSSQALIHLTKTSKDYFVKTQGAFDITILPVLRDLEYSFKVKGQPPRGLHRFRQVVNSELLRVDNSCVVFQRPGMAITLDGIAKGYAIDFIATKLPADVESYLLNFSGNMLWKGRKPSGPWTIGFWNPIVQQVVSLRVGDAGAIASSGPEVAHFDNKQIWHHIIDPKSLRSPHFHASVTVLGDSAMECDILSTAFLTLDLPKARELWNREFRRLSVYFVDYQGATTSFERP
jgi:thiamine biosynthesis lipoprotein